MMTDKPGPLLTRFIRSQQCSCLRRLWAQTGEYTQTRVGGRCSPRTSSTLGSRVGTILEGGLQGFTGLLLGRNLSCSTGSASSVGVQLPEQSGCGGASSGVLYPSRVMLAPALLVKGSHLSVMLHNFSCLRNLHIHPSVFAGQSRIGTSLVLSQPLGDLSWGLKL